MIAGKVLPRQECDVMKTINFLGQQCIELSRGELTLLVSQSVGPRVLSLTIAGSRNLFAELPEITFECPGKGDFHVYGGHRLWHAPEEPARTYLPDDQPLEVKPIPEGIWVQQPTEADTGIQKTLKIELLPEANRVRIEHILANQGAWPVTCAAWAITQMATGGVAFLPQNTTLWENNPTLPNRHLTMWPYTDINSSAITWGNEVIRVWAAMETGMLKIGFPNPRGWLAYWLDGLLFIKRAVFNPQATYFDFGSSSECYCCPQFIELETLSPATTIKPGQSIHHFETWEVHTQVPWPEDVNTLVAWIEEMR